MSESWKAFNTWKSFGSGKCCCLLPGHLELAFLAEGSNEKECGFVGRRRECPVIVAPLGRVPAGVAIWGDSCTLPKKERCGRCPGNVGRKRHGRSTIEVHFWRQLLHQLQCGIVREQLHSQGNDFPTRVTLIGVGGCVRISIAAPRPNYASAPSYLGRLASVAATACFAAGVC